MNKNIVFTMWVEGPLDYFTKLSIKSWCRLGYDVHLYKYADFEVDADELPYIDVFDASEIVKKPNLSSYQEIADYFRFYKLLKLGGTWLDSDLILLKRLPQEDVIISSEHCKIYGSYAPKGRTFTPNIGVLRFNRCHPVMVKTVVAINRMVKKGYTTNTNNNSIMKKFQKLVLEDYRFLVSPPELYCPISWAYVNELYTKEDLIDTSKCEKPHLKYGINQRQIDSILNSSYGIHLWRNLYLTKGLKEKEIENSTLSKIINYINKAGDIEF